MPRRSANFPTTVNGQEAKSKKGSCGTRATKKSRDAFKGKVTKDLESMRILCLVPPLYHSGVTFMNYNNDENDSDNEFARGSAGYLFQIFQDDDRLCRDYSYDLDESSEDDDEEPAAPKLIEWKQDVTNPTKWTCTFPSYSSVLAVLYKHALGGTICSDHLRFISSVRFREWAEGDDAPLRAEQIARDFDLVLLTESFGWAVPLAHSFAAAYDPVLSFVPGTWVFVTAPTRTPQFRLLVTFCYPTGLGCNASQAWESPRFKTFWNPTSHFTIS